MTDIKEGFSPTFEQAKNLPHLNYNLFRSDPKFHFLAPVGKQINNPDTDALKSAADTNINLFLDYLRVEKPSRGYEGMAYHPLDVVDCRHIMMSTVLFDFLGARSHLRVVEIGGGFGNWARLTLPVIPIETWTIIDLDFVLELQKWYLQSVLEDYQYAKLQFLSSEEDTSELHTDVVIASHSLSEISWEHFLGYNTFLERTPYLFYARHKNYPSKELSDMKLDCLLTNFEVVKNVQSEGGLVDNYILKLL